MSQPAAQPTSGHIAGSIGLSSGDVSHEGDLVIDGNILDGRHVTATGSIHVAGVIQAAIVSAGRDLRADGGISGRGKAECRAGGDVFAKYIVKTAIHAKGSVTAGSEILGGEVFAGGDVRIESGVIMAGSVAAGGQVLCRKIGSMAGAKTMVASGVDLKLEAAASALLPDIEARRTRAAKIRQVVAPLLKNQRALNAAQKEKATELLFEADEIDAGIAKLLDELRARSQSILASTPKIYASETICAGAQIRLAELDVTLDAALAGPVTIVVRGIGSRRHLVAVDAENKTVDLRSLPVETALQATLARLLGESAGGSSKMAAA